MLFNSFVFAIFLPTVLALYWAMRRHTSWQNWMLLAASYLFYGWWDWRFLSLLIVSTVLDYFIGANVARLRAAQRFDDAKRLLIVSLVANLGILGFFKYFNFFADSFQRLFALLGWNMNPFVLNIVLPVGISFYTFQTLSYTIDVYRGDMPPARTLKDFALYVAFFPQLVAGPIERASALIPQLEAPRRFDRLQFMEGVHLVFWGLFKKVYVADNLAPIVNAAFSDPSASSWQVLLGIYAFAFQIYGDFSGYTDVARGSSKLMGFELMENFASPYVARNPSDFWRRWHISLSTWLRDYLYIPLGGNRGGEVMRYRNLALTMLLGGLWHGATWLFVLWGAYQGLLLVLHRLVTAPFAGRARPESRSMFAALFGEGWKALVMFQFTCFGWLIFRGESLSQIGRMLGRLADWSGPLDPALLTPFALFVLPLITIEALLGVARRQHLFALERVPATVRAVAYGILVYLFAFRGASSQSFIYFQF